MSNNDIARANLESYLGAEARKDWAADGDLYPVERVLIERYLPPPPARILDLGCGAGRTTLGLEAMGYDLEAIDMSEDLVDEAKRRVKRSRVHVMDARNLAFDSHSFDAALFSFNGFDCVYPSMARRDVFAEVKRVLKPGATFYYSGHNGLAAWGPRPGDTPGRLVRRDLQLLRAQRTTFGERTRYLAYPEGRHVQVLYSVLPHRHLADLREHGFRPLAVVGSRSYRRGPHFLDDSGLTVRNLARVSALCPHVHYIASSPT